MSNVMMACVVVFAALALVPGAMGAEFEAHPSIAVSEEFTDNLFETTTNRTSGYITRLMPGLTARYKAPALNGDLTYLFDYRYYDNRKRKDEITHTLNANGHLVAGGFMHLDVIEEYKRVSLDVTNDVTRESLFVNQSDRNVATVSPYVVIRPSGRTLVKPGYRFIDTRYFGSAGIDKKDHIAFLDMTYELTKRWSLTAGYIFNRQLADINNFNRHQALGGVRYEYADNCFAFAQAGKSWIRYDSGQQLNSILWDAGLSHVFDTVTTTITTGVKYDEDPLSNIVQESFVFGIVEKRFQRGSVSLSPLYSEYVLAMTDTVQTRKYGAAAHGQYELTSKLQTTLGFTAEKFEQPLQRSYFWRVQVDSGISCPLPGEMTASLTYRYVDYYSPGIAADNWHVNRGMIEISKVF